MLTIIVKAIVSLFTYSISNLFNIILFILLEKLAFLKTNHNGIVLNDVIKEQSTRPCQSNVTANIVKSIFVSYLQLASLTNISSIAIKPSKINKEPICVNDDTVARVLAFNEAVYSFGCENDSLQIGSPEWFPYLE